VQDVHRPTHHPHSKRGAVACFEGAFLMSLLTQPVERNNVTVSTHQETRPDVVQGVRYVLGHSLGEYTALVAAESLSFDDAVRLVVRRGVRTSTREP
jgi:acyl transferase domain-containing protein